MSRRISAVTVLVALLGLAVAASGAITVKLPPPDLTALVPLLALPLDKPQVPLPPVAPPAPPQRLPELPAPRLVTDLAQRPVAPIPPPRTLACNPLGTVLGVASELLECGRARYQRQEFAEARVAFQGAIQESSDQRLLQEARYWLGETLLRLGRIGEVERVFLLAVQDDPRSPFGLYAADNLGWVALELGDPGRALAHFDGLLKIAALPVLVAYAHHGRAMALYGLKRYAEARDEWAGLLNVGGFSAPSAPRALVTEATFWLGETLGRLGEHKSAAARLSSFTIAGPQLMTETGLLRLGWWSRAAGQPAEAAKAYRDFLTAYPRSSEVAWARVGLVQALLDLDDYAGAREEARRLEAADRGGALALPTWLLMRRWLTDKPRPDDARALDDELLARTLEAAPRAWVLLLSAELARETGQADEARNRFDLVRQSPGIPVLGFYAALGLARLDFDIREFARAEAGAKSLLKEALPDDLRAAALLLAGEAAYWARDYEDAAGFYARFLDDLPKHPQAPLVGLALGWAEFRRGGMDAARTRWTRFASEAPADPRAAEALLLAAELAARAGDAPATQRLFADIIARFPKTEQADVATVNRAILAIAGGRAAEALPELSLLAQRASASSYLGRVRVSRGIALLALGRSAEAQPDFRAALGQGEDALSRLGLGVVAFERAEWNVAAREFTEGRNAGAGELAAAAEYGLAAVAFNEGKTDDFKRSAAALLSRPDDPRITPNVLRGMEAVAVEEKRWRDGRELALRLATGFPRHAAAAPALADVGAAAGAAGQWPLAREMYEALGKRYPGHPETVAGRLVFAEALLRTDAPADARRELEAFVTGAAGDQRLPRALILLAEAQEAAGNRAAALELYARVDREYRGAKGEEAALLGSARLLQADGKWVEARGFLERALNQSDPGLVSEAAYRLGEGLRAAGQNEDAVEAYMTAAYVAPDSSWGRRALLAAGQSFAELRQTEAAVIVYKKLLAASDVEPELAATARSRLNALGVN